MITDDFSRDCFSQHGTTKMGLVCYTWFSDSLSRREEFVEIQKQEHTSCLFASNLSKWYNPATKLTFVTSSFHIKKNEYLSTHVVAMMKRLKLPTTNHCLSIWSKLLKLCYYNLLLSFTDKFVPEKKMEPTFYILFVQMENDHVSLNNMKKKVVHDL